MDERQLMSELVRTVCFAISEHIDINSCDQEKLKKGIEEFIQDNGFYLALKDFERSVVDAHFEKRARDLADRYAGNTGLFFENYELIEKARVITNRIHANVLAIRHGEYVNPEEIASIKEEFKSSITEITAIKGLREFLVLMISEGLADLESLEGLSDGISIRSKYD